MESRREERVRIRTSAIPVINYALQQNNIPIVRSVAIENDSREPLEHVELEITAVPQLCLPYKRHIDCVPAEKTLEITGIRLMPDAGYLAGITEKVTGCMNVELSCGGERIAQEHMEVTALAFDQWHGTVFHPELLAAFVTPNHPEVAGILARAAVFLGQWTGDPSLDAYQSRDPNRVLCQAGAVFEALKEQNITYAVAPASFEQTGQRVRLCDTVLRQKLGTCLDLTLLYAACLEAAGLHPLLILTQGHIFTGLWLEELLFPEAVGEDPAQITKRLADGVNEIAVVETTLLVSGKNASFDDARKAGEGHFIGVDPVEYVIDVRRARLSGISPLPQRVHTDGGWQVRPAEAVDPKGQTAPEKLGERAWEETEGKEEKIPKKAQWERKLLDLGMRNALINLRMTRTLAPVLAPSLDELENALSDGSDFALLPRPADWKQAEAGFENMHELGEATDLLRAEFQNRRLRSALTETELTKTVKELYRTSRTSVEENGANTLYLALGLLRWYESRRSTKPRYAPVVLLPVEMVRKSAAQGYVIRLRDDEPQMNITMLEKLKQDFGIAVCGLDPLPTDEHGVDTRKVFTLLRKAVMDQPGWDVLESAYLGTFSFSQFVMWNDIHSRADDLMRNKIVKSLMDGRLAWEAQPMEIGSRVPEDGVLLPLPADASQLYAIREASGGNSFVLHGPPGTGKSQTITSLIANALAQGRTVLFAAEKMAALDVVRKRLEGIGIGPFCLELHSNKSRKKDVLEQLRQAAEVSKRMSARQYAAQADRIAGMRVELDAYAECLHRTLPCGKSLYQLIEAYEEEKAAPDIGAFSREYVRGLSGSALEEHQILAERMVAAAKEAGHPAGHPLAAVALTEYSRQMQEQAARALEAYLTRLNRMAPHVRELAAGIGEREPADYGAMCRLAEIAGLMACWYEMPASWTQAEFPGRYFAEVAEMAEHFRRAETLSGLLRQNFGEDFLAQDGEGLYREFTQISGKWFLPKALGLKKLRGQISVWAKAPLEKEALGAHLAALRDYRRESAAADALLERYGGGLGFLYEGKGTDWDRIAQMAAEAGASARELQRICGSDDFLHTFCGRDKLRECVCGLRDGFEDLIRAREACRTLLRLREEPQGAEDGCKTGAKPGAQTESGAGAGVCAPAGPGTWIGEQIRMCAGILEHMDGLKEWIAFERIAAEAAGQGLGNVTAAYRGGLSHGEVLPAYRKAVLGALIFDAAAGDRTWEDFSAAVFQEKIAQYKRADRQLTDLAREEIYCRLAARVPDFTREAAHSSELGILQRFIRSGGRGTSIRRLFEQIPDLLSRLCPCMLMSPISAAQYLDPKREPFDLVVFDEASQLPTCKAAGVLARGKDAVIVGDPRQMPPTSFFAAAAAEEEDPDTEDMESILDDCLALNMPQTHLLWHYRSRHESLIAFSNSRFYENRLLTFPSVNDRESRVSLIHVDGVFDRGRQRTNRAEAEAVVAELARRCHDGSLSGMSAGVVTFNAPQQNLIDDLLGEACKADPELEKWAFDSAEPVFIKNLENVQGDERDVILFSVGYGPDENGRVYMNFGPLNRDGGWRRLNVAVSRARCEMVVYSTLRPEQIDPARTSSEGVLALRAFLEYAGRRELPLRESAAQTPADGRSGIARTVCGALREKGYETDLAVGQSGYRVDVGVIDPKDPGRYILGILLDGCAYGTAKTTRDREIAQISVLEGLGWNILRIWSADWWDNSKKVIGRVLSRLEEIRSGQETGAAESEAAAESKPAAESEAAAESKPAAEKEAAAGGAAAGRTTMPETGTAESGSAAPGEMTSVYMAAQLRMDALSADAFVHPDNRQGLRRKIQQVIDREAPVSEGTLIRRVVQSYGITRSGSRIQACMDETLKFMRIKSTRQDGQRIFWKETQDPEAYFVFRLSGEGENRRDIRDVPVQETAAAAAWVLYQQGGMQAEDLIRETAKALGYARLGGNVSAAAASGVEYAAARGYVVSGAGGNYLLSAAGREKMEKLP